ncbi:MAG: SDR family oxidoreductase [Ignavibacteria bacterium]|nr:SDR family oxidoreductase [Ignavibacteria bacterium]
MNDFSLKNKVAIVTGGCGLLGKQHSLALSEAGANVVVIDIDIIEAISASENLDTVSVGFGCDITDREQVVHVREKILDYFGRIDILVNNAAINDMVECPAAEIDLLRFENYPVDLWNRSIAVNLTGTFNCSQIFGSYMAENSGGSIINIASTYGIVAPDQSIYMREDGSQFYYKPPAYSATKGAIISFTKYLAAYWGKNNVRVNSLSPGGVENMQDKAFIDNYSKRTPLGRMANQEEYKGALVYLASNASSYMTGANLVVDGGWTCW